MMTADGHWSYEEASDATDALHGRWAEYLAEKEQADAQPTFVEFFAWMFYTKGKKDEADRARRDRQREIDKLGKGAETIDGIHYFSGTQEEIDDGPRDWLYR
jgi:hypothetical protein